MAIKQQLQQIGLSKSESLLYLYLLEHGLSTPPQIAKGTGMARTNCYNVLQSLKNQELIAEQRAGKRKAYLAKDPESLFYRVQERKVAIEELLPDLRSLYARHKNKPVIRFFEGFESVKEVYRMCYSTQEVFGIGSTSKMSGKSQKFYNQWLRDLKKNNVVFHDILSYPSGAKAALEMKEELRGLYDYKLMSKKFEDFPTDMLIWDDTIALLTLEEPIFGTVITNATLAKTFRIIFSAMWEKF